jgi:mono/diheme cytochrome c family protein
MDKGIGHAVVGVLILGLFATSQAAADEAQVKRGAYLVKAGDCEACHSRPGKPAFSGGEAINSPFGQLYPPNLTPDKTAGIGAWTDDEFYRAMHEGVDNKGRYLYPAFPYQWYTKVTRDDVLAIRAYLNTVPPSDIPSMPAHMAFPFNVRTGIGAWNALYFRAGTFQPDPKQSGEWNRGGYLVEGLGHCSDCHTPKNLAMAPDTARAFTGGDVDNWYAPNLTSDMTQGIGSWSIDDLVQFLRTGSAPGKGVAVGTMAQVVHDSLAYLTQEDVRAIAVYLKALPAKAEAHPAKPADVGTPQSAGELVYLANCASCHQQNGKGLPGSVPALDGNGLVTATGPDDVIRVILAGNLATATYSPMPAPGPHLSDQQIADVTDYVRNAWSNKAPIVAASGLVGDIRKKTVTTISGQGAYEQNGDPCYTGDALPVTMIADPDGQIGQALQAMKPETILQTIAPLVQHVRQSEPSRQQADIVNGLTLAYCRVEQKAGMLSNPDGRRRLNEFSLLVYSDLASRGHE